jgi:hypothetical protein
MSNHHEIQNYFSMVIDRKDDIVVLPREYKGSPDLFYSPKILITTERIYNKFKEHIRCDLEKTRLVFLED